jgi:hypothetical protein
LLETSDHYADSKTRRKKAKRNMEELKDFGELLARGASVVKAPDRQRMICSLQDAAYDGHAGD